MIFAVYYCSPETGVMELVFATNNQHKLKEIRDKVGEKFQIKSLTEVGITTEIPEDFPTLEQNASQKARFIFERCKMSCFADDTGLEVDSLNGEPGVFSARYSRTGDPVFPEMDVVTGNIHKLLLKLKDKTDRTAQFRTVISLILNGVEYQFEGTVKGKIIENLYGNGGFGYDPVFVPDGYYKTFAEMKLAEKNKISHRAKAVSALVEFLKKHYKA